MRSQNRFHAIAIGSICLVVTAIYFILQPANVAPQDNQQLLGDRYIQIYSATWGEDCNRYIDSEIANTPMRKDKNGMLLPGSKRQRVMPNNVLDKLSDACNGKLTCTIGANSSILGVEPMETCYKQLKVAYRCYTFDRLWSQTIAQGNMLSIDCNASAHQTVQ